MTAPLFVGQGIVIESLHLATGGVVSPGVIQNVGEPIVPGVARDVFGVRYGVDLDFPCDFTPKANSDLKLTDGVGGLRQVFARSLITVPGELFWRPNYGIGITEFLNLPATAANIAEIQRRIRASVEEAQDIDEIERLDVTVTGSLIEIDLAVLVARIPFDLGVRIRRA